MKPYTLVGVNGNAFSVMGYVVNAIKETGRRQYLNRNPILTKASCDNYRKLAMSGNYNELLCLSMDILDDLNTAMINHGFMNEEDEDY